MLPLRHRGPLVNDEQTPLAFKSEKKIVIMDQEFCKPFDVHSYMFLMTGRCSVLSLEKTG